MQFENSAGNFGGSAFRRPVGHDSVCGLSKLVALLPKYMQIVYNWSGKGVYGTDGRHEKLFNGIVVSTLTKYFDDILSTFHPL